MRAMKRLAWATDIHLNFLRAEGVDAFCDALAREAPDAIVLTGDLAEAPDLVAHLETMERRLARPIYFVLGNHDFYRGSIRGVRERVAALCEGSRHLRWMNREGVVELTPETGLVGHDGWADGRNGDYFGSPLLFTDWVVIEELGGLDRDARLAKLLHTRIGAPLLSVDRIVRTEGGKPIERTRSYYRSDIYSFTVHLTWSGEKSRGRVGWALEKHRK